MYAQSVKHGYISFGANLGDRKQTFELVRRALEEETFKLLRVSPLYETEPWGGVEGGAFLNSIFEVQAVADPHSTLSKLQELENQFGRQRPAANAARTCDLDILLWGTQQLNTPTLIVPHPRFHLRKFTLFPICDLIPDLEHPTLHKAFRRLLAECSDELAVRRLSPDEAAL